MNAILLMLRFLKVPPEVPSFIKVSSAFSVSSLPALQKLYYLDSRMPRITTTKTFMKLNGWERIGVVFSIIWGVGTAIIERKHQVNSVNDLWMAQLNQCLPVFTDDCVDLASKQHAELLALNSSNVSNILYVSLGPILVGWLTAYLAIKVFFWVKSGFQSNV